MSTDDKGPEEPSGHFLKEMWPKMMEMYAKIIEREIEEGKQLKGKLERWRRENPNGVVTFRRHCPHQEKLDNELELPSKGLYKATQRTVIDWLDTSKPPRPKNDDLILVITESTTRDPYITCILANAWFWPPKIRGNPPAKWWAPMPKDLPEQPCK